MQIKRDHKPEVSQVELTIELAANELTTYIDQACEKLSKEVNVPGFRPGKVPYFVLKTKIPELHIYEEVFYLAVNKTLPQALEQEKIEFIGQPKIEPLKLAPGNPLIYKATLALLPKVTLGDYKSFKVKKQKLEIDQKKVERTFADLQKMRASETLVKRPAKKGDKVILSFVVKQNNVPIEGGQAKDFPLTLGDGQFIPGFEDQVVGLSANEEKKFVLTFPENYPEKNLAGKKADFEVKVKDVYELTLPALDDKFAQGYNFKDFSEFKKQITDNIQHELEHKEEERLELALLEELMERTTFEPLPPLLVEMEIEKMFHELKHQIEESGAKFEDYLKNIKKTEADLRKEWQPQAEKRLKTALISRELSKLEKLEATAKDVDEELEKITKMYAAMPDLKKRLEAPEYRAHLQNMLSNRKVFKFLSGFVKD